MLIRIRSLLTMLALMVTVTAFADCAPPEDVSVPDGTKASEEEMTKGQDFIRDFMTANERYRQCLDDEAAALGAELTDEQKASTTSLYNESVDREQALVETFNNQVRAFNKANP